MSMGSAPPAHAVGLKRDKPLEWETKDTVAVAKAARNEPLTRPSAVVSAGRDRRRVEPVRRPVSIMSPLKSSVITSTLLLDNPSPVV
jgi:hypothetical protein